MRDRRHSRTPTVVAVLMAAALAMPTVLVASAAESPVADAAMRGDIDTVRALLREGADVNAAQGDGMTALHWAALNDDADIIEVLLYAGGAVEPTTRLGGYTPLHLAAMEGNGTAVARLLAAGSDEERVTTTGVRPLHLAAQAGVTGAVSALIDAGAAVDARDGYLERTPLHFATANNRLEAIALLLASGADVDAATKVTDYAAKARADSAARTARNRIKDAAKPPEQRANRGARNAPAVPAALAAAGAVRAGGQPPDPDDPPNRRGNPPQPPDPDDPPDRRATPPTPPDPDDPPARTGGAAAQTPPDPDDPPDRDTPSSRGSSAAPAAPDPDTPRALSSNEQIGTQGAFTALHYAVRDGRAEAARMLLEAGADINGRSGDASSPMLVATINGNYDLAMELLEMGADPNYASDDGVAPLFAAINQEWHLRTWYPQPTANEQQETTYLDLMKALLDAGADPNARTSTHVWYAAYNAGRMGVDFSGATALWRAAYALDVAAMRMLVEYGADPNISTISFGNRSPRNRRPASSSGEEPEADPSGLPPSKPGDPGVHPLHAASGVGFGTSRVGQQHRHVPDGWQAAVVYLVDELGVDVNVRDHQGYSALHNAASRGDDDMILFLLERGADPTFVSRRGQTTIDMANGPQQRVQPFPSTIALLERFGAINNNNCISC